MDGFGPLMEDGREGHVMRDYGKVHTSFWSSSTMRDLSEDGRMLALYLMTSPHNTISGVFRLPDGYASEDLQWTSPRVIKGFSELLSKGFANRCETTKWVWVIKHLEWNEPENPNQKKSARKVASAIPNECVWKAEFARVCGEIIGFEYEAQSNPSGTVGKPFANQEQEQEQEQKQEQEQEKKTRASRFDAQAHLLSLGVALQHAKDWLKNRKTKKLEPTLTAIEQAQHEAEKAGMAFPDAIKVAAGMGWGGFMAKWVEAEEAKGNHLRGTIPKNKAQVQGEQLDAAAEEFAANMAAKYGTSVDPQGGYVPPNDGNTIDME